MRKLVFFVAVAAAAASAPLSLVQNGKSDYAIVIASNASPSERHGAAELQKFLLEMSGARLPITSEPQPKMILVGSSPVLDKLNLKIPFDELGPEGFALRSAGKNLVIAGGKLRGTMYGVYSFLEKLGCRWFTRRRQPRPEDAHHPCRPPGRTQQPAFEYREPFFNEAGRRLGRAQQGQRRPQNLDEATGGKVKYYPFVHSFDELVPPAKYFKEHPEYFSLIDGRRRGERGQLCLTNPDVLGIGIESAERWIARASRRHHHLCVAKRLDRLVRVRQLPPR